MKLDRLITKFIEGEASAFDEIYERTRKPVYYTALSVLRDRWLAEDVMQATYLAVLQNIGSYKAGTNAVAWIVTIAKNKALNLKKSRLREQPVDERENELMFGTAQPDAYGELTDLARRILDDDEFSVLMLITACGYKRREIAAMLGMPTSTVSWKYGNALEKMRRALEERGQ